MTVPMWRFISSGEMTTQGRVLRISRISVRFRRKSGQIVVDQIRTVDKSRLVTRLGKIDDITGQKVLRLLHAMFAP